MVHDHYHHHTRRDWFSQVESWLGIDGSDGGDGGNSHGGHPKTTQQPDVQTTYVTADPTTITGKPEKTSPAGLGPPVQQTHATETTHTTKPKETTTIKKHTSTSTSTSTTSTSTSTTTTTKKKTTTTSSTSTSSTSTSTTIEPQTTTFSTATAATAALSTTSALTAALDQASTSTPSPSASAAASSSGGISGGAKAGIAIGVLLGIAAIAGIVLFWLHKQKKRRQEEEAAEAAAIDREKSFAPAATSQPARNYNSTAPTSPFGAHPVNQFNPTYGQPAGGAAVGAGFGAGLAGAAAATNALRESQSPWSANANSPSRQDPFTDPENPFSTPPTTAQNGSAQSSQVRDLTPSPTGSTSGVPSSLTAGKPPGEAAAAGIAAGAVGGAAIAAAAVAGKKSEENRTPSPEYREGSPENAGAPVASNVHRVQMGFTPSLADEMELHAGQLVRMLKAYDDGWTQCSSMDGSVTGIAPRTCLSARPLQPRRPPGPGQGPPRGGPPIMGPNGRPMSPAGARPPNGAGPPRFYQDGRPMTPSGTRSMSPGPSEMPRPLTPGGSSRPSSPSPSAGRARSNSNRPIVQAGPSPLAPPTGPLPSTPVQPNDQPQPQPQPSAIGRKPVPGQQ